jgi:hypothetical protein
MANLFDENDQFVGGPESPAVSAPPPRPAGTNPTTGKPLTMADVKTAMFGNKPDYSMGMNPAQLALAGAGGEFNEIGQGLMEKLQLLGKPKGDAGQALIDKINTDRAERAKINEMLYSNPSAVIGRIGASVIPAIAAPARLGAQVALTGATEFAKPGGDAVSGLGSELAGSTLRGATGAGATWGIGKLVNALGRSIGAARQQYTPEGVEAMKTSEAAQRLGLPPPTIGQLDPTSALGQVERNIPGYGARVVNQARALEKATGAESVPGVFDKGATYAKELADAARNRLDLGAQKYKAVDDFVEANGLSGYNPKYTANIITNVKNSGYPRAQELLDKYGWDISPVAGASASDLKSTELPMTTYHEMRVATNRALNKVNRMLDGPVPTAEDRAAKKYLSNLKTALDSDASDWAAKNKGNEDAMNLYKQATEYYRDVVAPTVLENPLASKLLSRTRGFPTGEEALRASLSTTGRPRADLLRPTMSQTGEDITQVLRNLPDVTESAMSGSVPSSPEWNPLRLAGTAMGHPIGAMEALLSHVPGLSEISSSPLAKKLYFSRNALEGAAPEAAQVARTGLQDIQARQLPSQGLLPRAAWGAAKVPQSDAQDLIDRILGRR